jgi:predicted Na+-dependent transporter
MNGSPPRKALLKQALGGGASIRVAEVGSSVMPLRGVLYGLALSGVVAAGQTAVSTHPPSIKSSEAMTQRAGGHALQNVRASTIDNLAPSPQPKSWGMALIALFAIGVACRADVRRLGRVTV